MLPCQSERSKEPNCLNSARLWLMDGILMRSRSLAHSFDSPAGIGEIHRVLLDTDEMLSGHDGGDAGRGAAHEWVENERLLHRIGKSRTRKGCKRHRLPLS